MARLCERRSSRPTRIFHLRRVVYSLFLAINDYFGFGLSILFINEVRR